MVKSAEHLNDSKLMTAFDDSVSKYKVMHGIEESSSEAKKATSSTGKYVPPFHKKNRKDKRRSKTVDKRNASRENVNRYDPLSIEENISEEACAPQCHVDMSNSNSQSGLDYTELLNQYNELEKKLHQISCQLYESGYRNSNYSEENAQYEAQNNQVPVNQDSNSMAVCSCCPNSNHCTKTPSTSLAQGTFSDKIDDTFTIAMDAARKAFSSLKLNHSEPGNEGHAESRMAVVDNGSETDLTEVLKAWYSAGFFTARYLMEQSAKKRHV